MLKDGKLHLAKYAPPPPNLPVYQQADPRDVSFIGRTNYEAPGESPKFIFGIRRKDRKNNVYIIGKAGVGKSKLMELLMRQDVTYGHGFCLIDPDGELIRSMIDFIPEERTADVVVFDPTDEDWPMAFNPLQGVPPEFRYQAALGIFEIMEKQFGAAWSHRIEHVLRLSLLALLDYPDATLHGLISLLTDVAYRNRVAAHASDTTVKRFFEIEFDDWAVKFEADAIMPIVNMMAKLLAHAAMRNIFIQKENKIDCNDIVARRRIFFVNLAKEKIGEHNAHFLGALILHKLRFAGIMRSQTEDISRKDFYLYLPEFPSIMQGSLINLFAESRKYGFGITGLHHYMAQLDPAALGTVLGNVGTIIAFRVSGEDAEKLEPEMTPVFKAKDIINLGTREFYIKETIEGENYDPFSAETLTVLPPPYASRKNEIIVLSRNAYTMPLGLVKELFHGT